MNNQRFHFSLSISPDDYKAFYEGVARHVQVVTHSGIRLRFPASVLRQFLTTSGIQGSFELEVDQNNKFVSIHRLN